MKNFLIITVVALFFQSCIKDKPTLQPATAVNFSSLHKVFITNEGNYMYNNASVTFYNPETKEVVSDIFKTQNNTTLGDVCESIVQVQNDIYLTVNNSNKIVIVNTDDFKIKTIITGFNSPRYVLPISFSKGYVSDLYANKIAVINLMTHTIKGYIPCTGWTEKMLLFYNKVFVTNMKRSYCYVIDVLKDSITDSVYVGQNAGSLVLDKNEKLWILSGGGSSEPAMLSRINPINLQIEKTFIFNLGEHPSNLIIDANAENLFYIKQHIYKLSIVDNSLPTTSFITSVGNTFYNMAYYNYYNQLYISDAMDYIQNSTIYVYNNSGQLLNTFKAGINASGFLLE